MARLTEEMIIARSKQSDLTQIKKLNCWCVLCEIISSFCDSSSKRRKKATKFLCRAFPAPLRSDMHLLIVSANKPGVAMPVICCMSMDETRNLREIESFSKSARRNRATRRALLSLS